jgi:predicted Rossmann fold nucleotide-binding protein DprA/Smf involved in DNA uptake
MLFALEAQASRQDEPLYPTAVLPTVTDPANTACITLGDRKILAQPFLALLCSERCSGDLIIQACDTAAALRQGGIPVVSGFHSLVERECLRILLRGRQPIVVAPARSLERMRVPKDLRDPLREGRLLLISPFDAKQKRATAALAAQRNDFVVALARVALIIYAEPGGLVNSLARKILDWGKPLFALESPANAALFAAGARPLRPEKLDELLATLKGD